MARQRKKAVHGGGSVYPRKSEGKERWVATIRDPETGKRIERYARSQKEAEQKLEDIKYEIRQSTLATGPHQTVKQFLEDWLEKTQRLNVRKSSYYRQESIIRKHILPAVGHLQLRKLTPLHVRNLYAAKAAEGLQ